VVSLTAAVGGVTESRNMRIMRTCGVVVLAALGRSGLLPAPAMAQSNGNRVSYDVEFSVQGSLLDPNCTATGTDLLSGTLVGLEPVPSHEPAFYVGTLTRTTRITLCGSRRTPQDEEVVCTMEITGRGFADVVFKVEADSAGAWLQYVEDRAEYANILPPPPTGPVTSTVTGTCDPEEMAELQADYDGGQTAGSPNGQPIELPRLPRSGYPLTFPPRPPVSIWTLKVLARR
jgi:hypothetical protein